MEDFLAGRDSSGTLPDVLGWHSAASEGYLGNVYEQVDSVVTLLDDLNIDIHRFEVNEAGWADSYKTSGAIVRLFATAERAAPLGLEFASTSYHDKWDEGFLGGSISNAEEKRYAWYIRKAYADMEGTLVHVNETEIVDGLATWDSADTTLTLLVGVYDSSSTDTINVKVKDLAELSGLIVNDVVNVLVHHYPGDDTTEAFGADEVLDERRLVFGDSLEIELTGVVGFDAFGITLTAIKPDTLPAPGLFETIQDAIDSTLIGNIAKVDSLNEFTGDLRIPNGVRVISSAGITPTIRGVGDTAVAFPENAVPFTSLDGLRILPSTSTSRLIVLRGAGSVRNCELDDDGRTPSYGIVADGNTGEIRDCTITMVNDTNVMTGIFLINSSTLVTGCEVNAKNGIQYSVGIKADYNSSSLITKTLVKATEHGIEVAGDNRISFCTVDSTYNDGILHHNSDDGTVEYSIVTNVGNAAAKGIIADTLRYCITPDGREAGWEEGTNYDDPLYCGDGDYTLRADSYGNPDNNASGLQIGAFPVACLFGTLARNVSWDGTKPNLPVLGDVTVPSGKTLTIDDGGILEFAKTDNQVDGTDSTRSELIVYGSLDLDGATVCLTSGAAVDSMGDWYGIRILGSGSADIDSACVEYADNGITFAGGSCSGTISQCTFRNNETTDVWTDDVYGADILVEDNTFYPAGGYAVSIGGFAEDVTIKNNTITDTNSSLGGIRMWSESSTPTALITGNTIDGSDAGVGILVERGAPVIVKNTVKEWLHGIKILADEALIGQQDSSSSDNTITDNTVGIFVWNEETKPVIRENQIHDNTFGVIAQYEGEPNLGTGPPQGGNHKPGNNNLDDNDTYCIWNRNPDGEPEIVARYNYFGACGGGLPTACWLGDMDLTGILCTAPASARGVAMAAVSGPPRGFVFRGVSPNPMRSQGVIYFSLESGVGLAQIEIFDVAGRRVWRRSDVQALPGLNQVQWDGRSENGRTLSSGVYFVRVEMSENGRQTQKILVIR